VDLDVAGMFCCGRGRLVTGAMFMAATRAKADRRKISPQIGTSVGRRDGVREDSGRGPYVSP
jgi:hypothetical protein